MAINVWTGRGIWEGWTMRKHYKNCKFGDSVLVDPEGNSYKPSDILLLKSKIEMNDEPDEKKRRQV